MRTHTLDGAPPLKLMSPPMLWLLLHLRFVSVLYVKLLYLAHLSIICMRRLSNPSAAVAAAPAWTRFDMSLTCFQLPPPPSPRPPPPLPYSPLCAPSALAILMLTHISCFINSHGVIKYATRPDKCLS